MNRKLKGNSEKYELEKFDGITLISLVITIVILIILAGIAIYISLGNNGIFIRTKQATEQYSEASAREKLETTLIELQADKANNEKFDKKEDVDLCISKNNMIVNGDIVNVAGWQFQIDRDRLEIKLNLGKSKSFIIGIQYIGTTSFTIKVENVKNMEEVEAYIYEIDGNKEEKIEKKEFTKEELEPETTHAVRAIAKYKDGTTVESNTVTIKTKPRIYLYNNGDTCNEITGGWKAVAEGRYDDTVSLVTPILTNNNEEGYMNLYLKSTNWRQAGILKMNNIIDYKQYKKICFEVTASLDKYNDSSAITFNYFLESEEIKELFFICYEKGIDKKTIFEVDIDELDKIEDICFYIQSTNGNGGAAGLNIYNVWLEK